MMKSLKTLLLAIGLTLLTSVAGYDSMAKEINANIHHEFLSKMLTRSLMEYKIYDVGNLWSAISNYGSYGDPNFDMTGRPSCEWPGGSDNNYLYDAGLWIGAILNEEKVVTTYYYSPETEWLTSGDPRPPLQFYIIGQGEFELNVTYDDLNPHPSSEHTPLGIRVSQRARSWSLLEPDYDDFIVLEYWIKNLGTNGDLEDLLVSWWFDFDVSSSDRVDPHIDDLVDFDGYDGLDTDTDELDVVENSVVGGTLPWVDANDNGVWDGYDEYGVPYGYNPGGDSNPNYDPSKIAPDGYPDEYTVWIKSPGDTILIPRNLSYMYDSDNPTTPEEDTGERNLPIPNTGYIGLRLMCTSDLGYVNDIFDLSPDTLGVVHSHQWWNWESDPKGSEEDKYNYMLGKHELSMGYQFLPNPRNIGDPIFDYRILLTTGPFDLPAGDSLRLVTGMVVGEGLKGLRANADNMLALCDSLGMCNCGVRGDANSDGSINVLDIIVVANIILEIIQPDECKLWRADCNGDGDINIQDALGIVNVILGIGECGP